jgi:hypothetical protein
MMTLLKNMGFKNWAKARDILEIYFYHALKGVAIVTFLNGLGIIGFQLCLVLQGTELLPRPSGR